MRPRSSLCLVAILDIVVRFALSGSVSAALYVVVTICHRSHSPRPFTVNVCWRASWLLGTRDSTETETMMLGLILMIAAVVFLFLAAFNVPTSRVSPGWMGMALWGLSIVLPRAMTF